MLNEPYIRYLGRVLKEKDSDLFNIDWSLSGFEVEFTGAVLTMTFAADAGIEPTGRFGAGSEPERPLWPMIGIVVDDGDVPAETFMIDGVEKVVAFDAGETGRHRVQVVKMTENVKCGLALKEIACDGEFLEVSGPVRPVCEIIGDSMTCGFGNTAPSPVRAFYAEEENAWMAYGALAARALGMQPQIVATSGMCLRMTEWNGRPYSAFDLYEYTDRPRQDRIFEICPDSNMTKLPGGLPETKADKWDFAQHPVDTIIINLGTNDADGCNYYDDPDRMAGLFGQDYIEFLHKVRSLNGPDTKILCVLGDMRYFLWENLRQAVAQYIDRYADENVHLLKLHGIRPGEQRGAGGHPSVATDQRMAEQIVSFLRNT